MNKNKKTIANQETTCLFTANIPNRPNPIRFFPISTSMPNPPADFQPISPSPPLPNCISLSSPPA